MAVDYITLNAIVDEMITILGESTVINDFLQTNYTKSLSIFKSIDQYKLPTEEDAPFAVLFKDGMDAGEQVNNWIYQIGIEIGLKDTSQIESTVGFAEVVETAGESKVEELSNKIYDELRTKIPCNANIDEMRMELDDTQYPLYISNLILRINIPQVIGSVVTLN